MVVNKNGECSKGGSQQEDDLIAANKIVFDMRE
jgi:hypothetical protein